eukprot:13454723-Alexandrium_andersonii.AAC.1
MPGSARRCPKAHRALSGSSGNARCCFVHLLLAMFRLPSGLHQLIVAEGPAGGRKTNTHSI